MRTDLATLDDVREAARRSGATLGLITRAVELTGEHGTTEADLRSIFFTVDEDRFQDAFALARASGRFVENDEKRPTRSGRLERQTVLRARRLTTFDGDGSGAAR